MPKVNAVLKMIANTASGASLMTKWTIRMQASKICSSRRMMMFSLPFSVAALTATPKINAKIISWQHVAVEGANRGFHRVARNQLDDRVGDRFRAARACVRSASTLCGVAA